MYHLLLKVVVVRVFSMNGVTDGAATVGNLYLNPIAEMFVFGCTIDYVEELGGSYLKVIDFKCKGELQLWRSLSQYKYDMMNKEY